jgi:hypothetical protein
MKFTPAPQNCLRTAQLRAGILVYGYEIYLNNNRWLYASLITDSFPLQLAPNLLLSNWEVQDCNIRSNCMLSGRPAKSWLGHCFCDCQQAKKKSECAFLAQCFDSQLLSHIIIDESDIIAHSALSPKS